LGHFTFLLAFICLAIAIRLPGVGVPLFGDEATTFWEHADSSWQTLFSQYKGPNQHSFFSFLSNISMQIFGENEISFRLPSIAAGVLLIPLTWLAGRKLLLAPQVSLLAAFLVSFSMPLFEQSQQGRGYTLTVLFALIVFITGKKVLSEKYDWRVLLVFILSGFCMVLILPSNIYFLAACGAFLLADYWLENKNNKEFVNLFLQGLPILLMGGLAAFYLLFIYEDLQRGLETYRIYARDMEGLASLEPTLKRSGEIFIELAQPWGIPLCLFFVYGFFNFRNPTLLLLFLLPLVFNLVWGVQGPSRSYFYWVPFFMLIAAKGIVHLYDRINLFLPKGMNKVIFLVVALLLVLPPVNYINKFYEHRFETKFVKMEEAQNALQYIEGFPQDYLFVIPWEDRVLRRYIEERVAKNMLNIVRERNLKGIIFMGHNSLPPEKISISGLFSETSFVPEYFKLVEKKDSLSIYNFDFLITRIFPLEKGFDFQNLLNNKIPPGIQMSTEKKHKFVGKESLKVEGTGSPSHVVSKYLMSVNLPPGTAFVLYLYTKKLNQKSKAGLMVSKKREGKADSLNSLFGIFREENGGLIWEPEHPYRNFRQTTKRQGDFYWQIVMLSSPIEVGLNHFKEALKIQNETSYFDAMQAYVLHSEKFK